MPEKTVARTAHRKIAKVRAQYTEVTEFSETNQFSPVRVTNPDGAWAQLSRFGFARLGYNADLDKYTIRVHANRWYVLSKPSETAMQPVAEKELATVAEVTLRIKVDPAGVAGLPSKQLIAEAISAAMRQAGLESTESVRVQWDTKVLDLLDV